MAKKKEDEKKEPKVTVNATVPQNPETPAAGKKGKKEPKHFVYFSRYGNLKQKLVIESPNGLVTKYAQFRDNKYTTSNKDEAQALEMLIEAAEEAGIPIEQRNVLNDEQYFSVTSPERLWVPYEGKNYHISVVRQALDFAVSKGFELKADEKVIIQNTLGRVKAGGAISAGSIGG